MGTNYYLKPRGYDELKIINKSIKLSISSLLQSYRDELNKIIEKSDSFCPIYPEILDRADPDNIDIKLEWEFEEPDVHICKLSGGWKPLFEQTKFYSSFEEFEDFYNKYKDYFTIINEEGIELTFEGFKKNVFEKVSNTENQSHLQYNSQLDYSIKYYKDNLGVEWTNTRFS